MQRTQDLKNGQNFDLILCIFWTETTFIWESHTSQQQKLTLNGPTFHDNYARALSLHPEIEHLGLQKVITRTGPTETEYRLAEVRMEETVSMGELDTEAELSEPEDMVREVVYQPEYKVVRDGSGMYRLRDYEENEEDWDDLGDMEARMEEGDWDRMWKTESEMLD